jgi:hypothetical protein
MKPSNKVLSHPLASLQLPLLDGGDQTELQLQLTKAELQKQPLFPSQEGIEPSIMNHNCMISFGLIPGIFQFASQSIAGAIQPPNQIQFSSCTRKINPNSTTTQKYNF